MKKFWIIVSLILSLLVLLVVPIVFVWLKLPFGSEVVYNVPERVYYTSQVVGVYATLAAVVVAIFGVEIKKILLGEKCAISLVNDGFYEVLGETADTSTPESQHYDCCLLLSNIGSREISDCQIQLCEVQYKSLSASKFRTLETFDNLFLHWKTASVKSSTLFVGDSYKFPLCVIYPQNDVQTPDDKTSSPLRMRIIGYRLSPQYSEKGTWRMVYKIRSREKVLKNFEIIASWDGSWHSRINEMSSVVSVNLKEI